MGQIHSAISTNTMCNTMDKADKEAASLFLELSYIRDDLATGPGVDFLR